MRIAEQFFHRRASGGKLRLIGDKEALFLYAGEKADGFRFGQCVQSRRRFRFCRQFRRYAAINGCRGADPGAKLNLPRIEQLCLRRRYAHIRSKRIRILCAVRLCRKDDRQLCFNLLQPFRVLADIQYRAPYAPLDPDGSLLQSFRAQIHRSVYVQNAGDIRQRIGNDRFERLLTV